jgi:hypothetical protein
LSNCSTVRQEQSFRISSILLAFATAGSGFVVGVVVVALVVGLGFFAGLFLISS